MPERIQRSRPKGERRFDKDGELRLMAQADGWIMCRHPGCIPFTMPFREWAALPMSAEAANA